MATINADNGLEQIIFEVIEDGGTLAALPCLTSLSVSPNEDTDSVQCKGSANANVVKVGKGTTFEVEMVDNNEDIQIALFKSSMKGTNERKEQLLRFLREKDSSFLSLTI